MKQFVTVMRTSERAFDREVNDLLEQGYEFMTTPTLSRNGDGDRFHLVYMRLPTKQSEKLVA